MAKVSVRAAKLCDIARITPREQDVDELRAGLGGTPEQAMRFGIEMGTAWYGAIAGQPAGIFGFVQDGRIGCPWAVFTEVVERYPQSFLKACRPYVARMKRECDVLYNFVDARNTRVIRWIEWLGFTVHEAAPWGVEGRLFRRFDWHV